MLGFLLLQVGFIQKNIKLSTYWYITCYNMLHILAVFVANLLAEDHFDMSKNKTYCCLIFENAVNIFENISIQNSHNLMSHV